MFFHDYYSTTGTPSLKGWALRAHPSFVILQFPEARPSEIAYFSLAIDNLYDFTTITRTNGFGPPRKG